MSNQLILCLAKKPPFRLLVALTLACGVAAYRAPAQDDSSFAPAATAATSPLLGGDDLEQLLKPIALYPDPLLAQILAAATFPAQIVMAEQFVEQGGDMNNAAEQPWDASVQGLVHYPTVLQWLDENLPWTTVLGQNYAGQPEAVMDAVQRLRDEARAEGNLPSVAQETVVDDDYGDIEIEPADPDEIYVPQYPDDTIYTQPGVLCGFGVGFPIGVWLGFDWDWHHHGLIAWGHGHSRPNDWWRRPPGERVPPSGMHPWHPGSRGPSAFNMGADRGFAAQPYHPTHVLTPNRPAPEVHNFPGQPAEVNRGEPRQEAPREETPREAPRQEGPTVITIPHPVERPAAGFGSFGPENSSEAREASSRGSASRASSGGGGGGAGRRNH